VAGNHLYPAFPTDRVRLAPLGTGGLMAAVRDPAGNVKLVAVDAHRNANNTDEILLTPSVASPSLR